MSIAKALDELYGKPDEFLNRVRSELQLRGLSIYGLARWAQMDYCNVKKYFSGRRRPMLDTMIRLDDALADYLREDDDVT